MSIPAFSVRSLVFSLGLLGIAAAITIGFLIQRAREEAEVAVVRKHAVTLANLCATARSHGVQFVTGEYQSTIQQLRTGAAAIGPDGKQVYFRAVGISAEQAEAAKRFLKIEQGQLIYVPGDVAQE